MIASRWLFPPFKTPSAKSRITGCHFQSNRSAGPPLSSYYQEANPWFPEPGSLAALGVRPSRSLLRIPEGPRRLMSALGGPDAQRSALNFPLSAENCRFFNAIAGFKGKLTGEHKSIDLRFIHKQ